MVNPLTIKVDINEAVRNLHGFTTKFKENRTYDREAYDELLDKYVEAVKLVDTLRSELEAERADKLPDENDIKAIDAMASLIGAKNQDGSLNFGRLVEFGQTFGKQGAAK